MGKRRTFSREFKLAAVKKVVERGLSYEAEATAGKKRLAKVRHARSLLSLVESPELRRRADHLLATFYGDLRSLEPEEQVVVTGVVSELLRSAAHFREQAEAKQADTFNAEIAATLVCRSDQ